MSQRPSLAENMSQTVARRADSPYQYHASTRVGMKKLTAVITPEAWVQFRQLALEEGVTGELLLAEAINDLFGKYDKPRIV